LAGLPGQNGMTILKCLRRSGNAVPLRIATARDPVSDRRIARQLDIPGEPAFVVAGVAPMGGATRQGAKISSARR